jgi:hypothetical protein
VVSRITRRSGLLLQIALLGSLLPALGGCKLIAVPFFAFGQDQTKKVPAEYPYLEGKQVCIVVWADEYTTFQYQFLPLEVSEHVRVALDASVRGLTIVPNREVIDYQKREPDWQAQNPAKIGKKFGADRVIMIELTQYTTREPGSMHLYRGHMGGNIKIFDTAYPESGPTYQTVVEVAYPPDNFAAYGTDERTLRRAILELFANDLAGRFHERQEKVK